MSEQANQSAASAATERPAEKPSRRPGRAGWRVAGAALVVIALGGVWITWPLWSPSLPGWLRGPLASVMDAGRGGAEGARIAAAEQKLAAIESDLAALRREMATRPAGAAAGSAKLADDVKTLAERAAATDRALAELRERAAHVEPMENRIAVLDAAIKALPAQPGTPAAPAADAAALARLRGDTATSIGALQQQDQNLATQLADAEKRIAALEARAMASGTASRETAFVLAVGQLRDAVRSGRPFADALAGLRAIAGDDREPAAALAALQPFAGSGVADLASLRARFALVAPRIAAAAPRAGASGWWDQTLARLSSVVSIRRTGPAAAAGQGPEAAVARAELALGGGDIAAAVKDLEGLGGPAADAAAPWLAGARARLAADSSVAALESIAIGRLGGAKGPGAPTGASGG